MIALTVPVAAMTHRGVATCVLCLAALGTACQQTQTAAARQTPYQVRVSALAEGRALAQSGRAFVRLCAPADMTLAIVEAANGPANLENVEDSRADIAFV